MADYVGGDMIRGHIDTIILNSLIDSDKDTNQIRAEIEAKAGGKFKLKQGTFYSALQRISKQGFVNEYRGPAADGVRRKFFQLTEKGKAHIEKTQSSWNVSQNVINKLLDAEPVPEAQPEVEKVEEEIKIPSFEDPAKVSDFSDIGTEDVIEQSEADKLLYETSIEEAKLADEVSPEPQTEQIHDDEMDALLDALRFTSEDENEIETQDNSESADKQDARQDDSSDSRYDSDYNVIGNTEYVSDIATNAFVNNKDTDDKTEDRIDDTQTAPATENENVIDIEENSAETNAIEEKTDALNLRSEEDIQETNEDARQPAPATENEEKSDKTDEESIADDQKANDESKDDLLQQTAAAVSENAAFDYDKLKEAIREVIKEEVSLSESERLTEENNSENITQTLSSEQESEPEKPVKLKSEEIFDEDELKKGRKFEQMVMNTDPAPRSDEATDEIDDFLKPDAVPDQKEYKEILSKIFASSFKTERDDKTAEHVNQADYGTNNESADINPGQNVNIETEFVESEDNSDDADFTPQPRKIKPESDARSDVQKTQRKRNTGSFDYSDILELSEQEGFKVSTSDSTNKSELGKILVNRLNFHASALFFALIVLETLVVGLTMDSVLKFGFTAYLIFDIIVLLLPAATGVIYYVSPRKTVNEVRPFKSVFETALIITLNLILLILVLAVVLNVDFTSQVEISRTIFVPVLAVINLPLFVVFRYSLLDKQMYYS